MEIVCGDSDSELLIALVRFDLDVIRSFLFTASFCQSSCNGTGCAFARVCSHFCVLFVYIFMFFALEAIFERGFHLLRLEVQA